MCVDAGVARRAGEVLVFPVRYVLVCARVAVLLGQAEVDDVDEVALLAEAHEEVVRFDVAVNEVLRMYVFYAADLKNESQFAMYMYVSWLNPFHCANHYHAIEHA